MFEQTEIPIRWRNEANRLPAWAEQIATGMGLRACDADWLVTIAVPDHVDMISYSVWHNDRSGRDDGVLITVQDKATFVKTYGLGTLRSTLQSLRADGRPLATWSKVVFAKEISIVVQRLSGSSQEYHRVQLDQTVTQFKAFVAPWVLDLHPCYSEISGPEDLHLV